MAARLSVIRLLVVLAATLPAVASAGGGHAVDESVPVLAGGAYAPEPSAGWSPEEAWRAYRAGSFDRIEGSSANLGMVDTAVWLSFSIPPGVPGPTGGALLHLDWHKFQVAELYENGEAGWRRIPRLELISSLTGVADVSQRPLYRLPPRPAGAYLMRLRSYGPLLLQPMVHSPRAFLAQERLRSTGMGIYFGAIGALVLYNAFLWLTLRDRSYLWYTVFITLAAAFVALNWGVRLEWVPDASRRIVFVFVTGVIAALAAAGLLFSRSFLITRHRDPLSDRLIRYGLIVVAAAVPVSMVVSERWSIRYDSVMGLIAVAVLLTVAIRGMLRGFQPVYFVTPAWLVLIAATVAHVGVYNGALPYNDWTVHAYPIGSALEAVLLSMALAYRVRRLERERAMLSAQRQRYRQLSLTDPVTGLHNKRHLADALDTVVSRSEEEGGPVAVVLVDLDHFKDWNDNWGHQAGDRVLEAVGATIREQVRDEDVPCRFGGEEFVIVLPDANVDEALKIAERVREAIAGLRFHPEPAVAAGVTASVGVAQRLPGESPQALLERADAALYRAKAAGRNRYVLAETGS